MKKIAIITGASSGMGVHLAHQASQFYTLDEIWLLARREDHLNQVAQGIQGPKPVVLAWDLTQKSSQDQLIQKLAQEKPQIQFLAANAGYGKFGLFDQIPRDQTLGMIELNVTSLTALVYDCLPYMTSGSGILLLGSIAAYVPLPSLNVYAATKAYVRSFGLSLHADLKPRGIRVTTLCPGPVDTEFSQVASGGKKDGPLSGGAPAGLIIRRALKALGRGKSLLLPRWDWVLGAYFSRWLPGTWLAAATRTLLAPKKN